MHAERRGRTGGARSGSAAVSWPAFSTAVALLTARQTGLGDSQDAILGDQPPGDVLKSLEIVAAALLDALTPDNGARVLEALGLLAATRSL